MTATTVWERAEAGAEAPVPALVVEGLRTEIQTREGVMAAVDDVSFSVAAGEALGIVGESGCGKSMTALSIMRLEPSPPARIVAGRALLYGQDLLALPEEKMAAIRGDRIAMIFQDPMTSLNPTMTVGRQVAEVFRIHRNVSRAAAWNEAGRMLENVHIPNGAARRGDYPHQFSGGMRQRAMIAMALACQPDLLIADEPTTALDVTVQAQILRQLLEIKRNQRTGIVLVTHDLGVVARLCDRVAVMYAGRIVETGTVRQVLKEPVHPYTRGLLRSSVRLGGFAERLEPIEGQPPNMARLPAGCSFAPRCPRAFDRCHADSPPPIAVGEGREARCWLAAEERS